MIYTGSCHCGSVQLEVETNLEIIKQCNCSICKRKFAKMNLISKEQLKIINGSENLSIYEFASKKAKHFFCKKCGIYTHHIRRSDQNAIGVNIGCLDNIDVFNINSEVLDNK